MNAPLTVSTVDYHTAGEPFRIVTGGVLPLRGRTILEKRRWASENLDHVRQLLINEPRGHADMYGCFVTEPDDDYGDLGVVFFHNEGYSTACGHGTIALVTWALESGVVAAKDGENQVIVDVPSGRLSTVAQLQGGRVRSVRFRNVPSYVESTGASYRIGAGDVATDIAYGGAFYAAVDASALGLEVTPRHLDRFIGFGRELKTAIHAARDVVHPLEPELRDIYGVIFYEDLPERDGMLVQRNVTIFADGEVDRSPCGSGTSARLALLDREGKLARGRRLLHLGILNTEFIGEVVGDAQVGEHPAVVTEVEGSAHISSYNHFVLDESDPLGTGFLLR
jgi:proline racemase/trans-L-3-hydroxyproline dehydratase